LSDSLDHIGGTAQLGLHCDGLDAQVRELLERRLGLDLGLGRVVVDCDVDAPLGERLGDEGTEVLMSATSWR
jgi:hypothetical protein